MGLYAVTLRPRCAFASPIRSDTLFGAMIWGARWIHKPPDFEQLLKRLPDSPPVAVSSAFPCSFAGRETLRFFPMPILPPLQTPDIQKFTAELQKKKPKLTPKQALIQIVELNKKLNRLAFVSHSLFTEIITGRLTRPSIFASLLYAEETEKDLQLCGNILMGKNEAATFKAPEIREVMAQGNAVDRVGLATAEGQLFMRTGVSFAEHTGLWFLFYAEDAAFWRPVLRWLEDTGLGGDRSVGKGQFAFSEPEPFELPAVERADAVVMLSRYLPAHDEIDWSAKPIFYHLVGHRGKVENRFSASQHPYRERGVRLFAEGSVFPLPQSQKPFYGRLIQVDVQEDRSVYHAGTAIAVKAAIGGRA
ncbi:MAG: type III-A CRISPR-associated RAMP protein Csm4 [candidate division KSB1 bacterium]|nr:type III-A CRISPR-associated RAMP protein Csm4 [candidate division KSB1 bacterium]